MESFDIASYNRAVRVLLALHELGYIEDGVLSADGVRALERHAENMRRISSRIDINKIARDGPDGLSIAFPGYIKLTAADHLRRGGGALLC